MRTYKPRNRDKLLEQRNQNALTQLLKSKVTLEEKREMIKERNPYLFVFGENLVVQGDMDYTTYINKLYLGDVQPQGEAK